MRSNSCATPSTHYSLEDGGDAIVINHALPREKYRPFEDFMAWSRSRLAR